MNIPSPVERSARRKTMRRLLPFLWLLYVVAFLDRVNVAYAALEMSRDLRFSDRVFGAGAGIFFVGYVLLQIPGAITVERWSARRWIGGLMVCWGITTFFVGLVHTAHQFYAARFFLGAAEAGFYPGVMVYLTHWFPQEDRGKAVALFIAATPVSNILGSPVAGQILRLHWHGLEGWRWLFILEGLPAIVLGFIALFYLTDWPRQASWLTEGERAWIAAGLDRERQRKAAHGSYTAWQAVWQRDVLLLSLAYFAGSTGLYGFIIWLPTILKRSSGFSTGTVTSLAALPYLAALAGMLLNGWHSDRTGERRWHSAGPLFAGGMALILAIVSGPHFWAHLVFFALFAACVHGYMAAFWTLPTAFLGESAAAASIGLINSVGGLGGFAGPFIIGYLATRSGSFVPGLGWLLVNLFLAGIIILVLRQRKPASPA